MKVLLAKPVGGRLRYFTYGPDLGLGYLAASLRKKGHDVTILDCMLERMDHSDFEEFFRKGNFDAVGFKFFSMNYHPVRRQLETVKRLRPDAITLVGGAHPSAMPKEVLRQMPQADFAFRGEAEVGLPELLAAHERARGGTIDPVELKGISGLIWRDGEQIQVNGQWLAPELDELESPAWDLMQVPRYMKVPNGRNPYFIPIVTSRGCPYPCSYCSAASMNGKPIRYRSPKLVVDEMQFLRDQYGVNFITLSDDNFTMQPHHVFAICDEMISRNLGIEWGTQQNGIRLDTVSVDLLHRMEKAGCRTITVAVESGSQRVLKDMKKGFTLEEVREKVALIKRETNFTLNGFFILGYPIETRKDLMETIEFSRSLPLDSVNYNLFSPLPGTEITDRLLKTGQLQEIDWSTQNLDVVSIPLKDVSARELQRIYFRAWLGFYLQPRVLWGIVRNLLDQPLRFFNFIRSCRHVVLRRV